MSEHTKHWLFTVFLGSTNVNVCHTAPGTMSRHTAGLSDAQILNPSKEHTARTGLFLMWPSAQVCSATACVMHAHTWMRALQWPLCSGPHVQPSLVKGTVLQVHSPTNKPGGSIQTSRWWICRCLLRAHQSCSSRQQLPTDSPSHFSSVRNTCADTWTSACSQAWSNL